MLHGVTLQYDKVKYSTIKYGIILIRLFTVYCIALRCNTIQYVAWHCITCTLYYITLHYLTLHCIELHFTTTLHYRNWKWKYNILLLHTDFSQPEFQIVFFFQRNCIEFALKARPQRSYIPKNKIQFHIWKVVTSQPFEYLIFAFITCNTVVLMMQVGQQLWSAVSLKREIRYMLHILYPFFSFQCYWTSLKSYPCVMVHCCQLLVASLSTTYYFINPRTPIAYRLRWQLDRASDTPFISFNCIVHKNWVWWSLFSANVLCTMQTI